MGGIFDPGGAEGDNSGRPWILHVGSPPTLAEWNTHTMTTEDEKRALIEAIIDAAQSRGPLTSLIPGWYTADHFNTLATDIVATMEPLIEKMMERAFAGNDEIMERLPFKEIESGTP